MAHSSDMAGNFPSPVAAIDLGEGWAEPAAEITSRVPTRAVRLLAVGLALLLLLAGSVLPRPGLTSLFTVPIDVNSAYALDSRTLYVSRVGQISAYRLPGGARLWQRTDQHAVGTLAVVPGAGVVLAELRAAPPPTGVLALDARTGQVLWRVAQMAVAGILADQRTALLAMLDDTGVSAVYGVDLRTGRPIWQRQLDSAVTLVMAGASESDRDLGHLVVFDGSGGLTEVVDGATGGVLVRSRLIAHEPVPAGTVDEATDGIAPDYKPGMLLSATRRLLLVATSGHQQTSIDAYDLATLNPRWHVTLPRAVFIVGECGAVLCANGSSTITGLDPLTGAELWHTVSIRNVITLPGGRLLVSGEGLGNADSIVEAASLRPVLSLGRWAPLGGTDTGPVVVARDDINLRTWFAVVAGTDAKSVGRGTIPAIHPLGSAWGIRRDSCGVDDAGYLACVTIRNELTVWSYT
jgi:outer membrane protein assembly factor BamB